MAFCPFEGKGVGGEEGVYSFPEVLVQDGGAFGCDPAVSFPVVQPSLGDGSLEVLAGSVGFFKVSLES